MGIPRAPPIPSSPKKRNSPSLRLLFELDTSTDAILRNSPGSPTDDILMLISNCTHLFTFINPAESPAQQDLKRRSLLHIISTLRNTRSSLDARILTPLFSMLTTNLFRPLPPPRFPCLWSDSFDDDTPPMVLSHAWPHLHIVYDILTILVASIDPKCLRSYIDHTFLLNLLALFHSEDPRERDRLKNIYHQLYARMTPERSFMRRSIRNTFLHFAMEMERHCGIAELLEIWGSIINGFAVPLKGEHKVFLARVLIPLHKPKGICMYHRQLSYCITQFVIKDPGLSVAVVKGILRYWPVTNCPKEVLFIGELEDLVDVMEAEEFDKVAVMLCSQIAKSLTSCNSQVAERALYVWSNEQFVSMASRCMEEVLPSMVQAMEKNITWHWNKSVQNLTAGVKKMLKEREPALYSKCLEDIKLQQSMAAQEEKRRAEMWQRLEWAASDRNHLQPANSLCVSN